MSTGDGFMEGIRRLVEDTATSVAESSLRRSLDAINDLRSRAERLVGEAEALSPRVAASLDFVERAQKAGAIPFIGAAKRTGFTTLDVGKDGYVDGCYSGDLHPFSLTLRTSDIGLPPGRYSVVLSLYKQGE